MNVHSTTRPIFCDNCHAAVRLAKNSQGYLVAECACGETRNVKIANKSPEAWSPIE